MLRFFIILTALGAGPAAMAQHILEPLEQGDYEALEGPPNADRAGISFFSQPSFRSEPNGMWRIDYEVCNQVSDHGIGFNWVEPSFAISRYHRWVGLAPRQCSYVWSDAWAVVSMDRTELVRNNGNSLQPAAYLRCPIDLCSGDENGILDSDQVTEMGLRATVIDSRTGDTYPIELSQRTRQAEAEVQYSLEWSGQNGIVVQIFPELIFEEIAPEEYLSEASGSYVTSGEAVFRSWDDNYSQQSALIVLADLADAPTGEATITLSADGLNFRQSFVAIVDYDGSLIVGLKGLDL